VQSHSTCRCKAQEYSQLGNCWQLDWDMIEPARPTWVEKACISKSPLRNLALVRNFKGLHDHSKEETQQCELPDEHPDDKEQEGNAIVCRANGAAASRSFMDSTINFTTLHWLSQGACACKPVPCKRCVPSTGGMVCRRFQSANMEHWQYGKGVQKEFSPEHDLFPVLQREHLDMPLDHLTDRGARSGQQLRQHTQHAQKNRDCARCLNVLA
jgi:hypothetical protein